MFNMRNLLCISILIYVQVNGKPAQMKPRQYSVGDINDGLHVNPEGGHKFTKVNPTQRRMMEHVGGSHPCTSNHDCDADHECIHPPRYHLRGKGTCSRINFETQPMWIHYPMQWCTPDGRNPDKLGTMTLEACQETCTGLCLGIEWWEGDSACFECTDSLSMAVFNNTDDTGYPPDVYIKARFCHGSIISCPESCAFGHSDWDGQSYGICECTPECQCLGDGWCYVDGPTLPRCDFATCTGECTVEEMPWKGQTYQSCQCAGSDLCYMGAINEECQGAVDIFTDDPIQDSTPLALSDGAFAGLCPDWSSPELANGVWFKFDPEGDTGSYHATTVSPMTNYDTQIAVFSSSSGDCSVLECLGSNDDSINLQSEVVFVQESGMAIYILVAGTLEAKGQFELLVAEYEDQPVQGWMLNPAVHKTVDGCPDINAGPILDSFPTCVPDSEAVAAAVCCSTYDDSCNSGSYCSGLVTFDDAKQFCLDIGDFHLCTEAEIESSACCESLCFNDLQRMWSSDKCTVDEGGILEILYEAVGGRASKLDWDFPADHCSLDGVSCQNGWITSLVLSGMMLSGKIPSELGTLINLLELDVSTNELSGIIPKELGSLPNLLRLYLSGNQMSGPVPWEFGNLPNLLDLDLSDNELFGPIPCELGKFENLSKLLLSGNRLSGAIPSELGNLASLVELDLSDNELSGSNPNELGNLSNLTRLYLAGNGLIGTVNRELGYLSRINYLSLHDNKLSGTIPTEFGNLTSAYELNLSYNELSGTIPSNLGDLTTIERLDLSNNDLSDAIPTVLGHLEGVYELDISNNDLSGTIPKELGHPQNLVSLNLSHNRLTGSIPSDFGALSNIAELHLSHNELSGDIPSELGNAQRLALLNTEGNDGLGMFPEMRCCFEMHHHYRTVGVPRLLGGSNGAGRLVQQYKLQNNNGIITVDIAMNNADLVCKSLGLGKAFVVFEGTPYGKGTEPYYVQTIQNVSSFTTGSYEIISLICDTGVDGTIFVVFGILIFILLLGVFGYTWRESKTLNSSPSIICKSFIWNSLRAAVIGIMTCDTVLDILVAAQLYGTGQKVWFSASVIIICVSSVLLSLCLSRTLYFDLEIHEVIFVYLIGHAIPVILFLHPLLSDRIKTRYERWLQAASKVVGIPDKEHCPTKLTRFIKNRMDAAFMFAIIERFLESIPQMILQLSIVTVNRGTTPLQSASLLASLLSISMASVIFAWCSDNASFIFLLLSSWSDVVLLALTACMLSINTTISQDVFFMTKEIPLLMTVWAYTMLAVFLVMTLTSFYKFVNVLPRWSVQFDGAWSYFRVVPIFFFSVLTGFITMLITIVLNFSFFILEHNRLDKTCLSHGELSSFLDQASLFSKKYLHVSFKAQDETSEEYGSLKCISVVTRWNLGLVFKSSKTVLLFAAFKLYLCAIVYLTYFYEHPGFGLYSLGTVVDVVAYGSVVLTLLTIVGFPRFAKYRYFIIKQQLLKPSKPPPPRSSPRSQKDLSIIPSLSHTDDDLSGILDNEADSDGTITPVDEHPKHVECDKCEIEMV